MTQTSTRNSLSAHLSSLVTSLKLTAKELAGALRVRNPSRAIALLREGSPLESAVSDLLYVVFLALLFAPTVILPAYYLVLALV